ncbi:hypothetical protein GQ600_5267 [Phytophthora cactorum]|nr:hypothetical protein GQ600_5267 [Phytophthora cactorum]
MCLQSSTYDLSVEAKIELHCLDKCSLTATLYASEASMILCTVSCVKPECQRGWRPRHRCIPFPLFVSDIPASHWGPAPIAPYLQAEVNQLYGIDVAAEVRRCCSEFGFRSQRGTYLVCTLASLRLRLCVAPIVYLAHCVPGLPSWTGRYCFVAWPRDNTEGVGFVRVGDVTLPELDIKLDRTLRKTVEDTCMRPTWKWLKWIQQGNHVAELTKSDEEDKDLNLQLVLGNEALDALKPSVRNENMSDNVKINKVSALWEIMHIPFTYNEQLEEELFLFAKHRSETVSECHKRKRGYTRVLEILSRSAITLDDTSLIRYFKRTMPNDYNTLPQAVHYFERLKQSDRRQEKKNRGEEISQCVFHAEQEFQTRERYEMEQMNEVKDTKGDTYESETGVWLQLRGRVQDYHESSASKVEQATPIVTEHPTDQDEEGTATTRGYGLYICSEIVALSRMLVFKLIPSTLMCEQSDGSLNAAGLMMVAFRFTELGTSSRITHTYTVIDGAADEMVIGRDLLDAGGIVIYFRDRAAQWYERKLFVNTGGGGIEAEITRLDAFLDAYIERYIVMQEEGCDENSIRKYITDVLNGRRFRARLHEDDALGRLAV